MKARKRDAALSVAMDAATERARRDLSANVRYFLTGETCERWQVIRKADGVVVDAFDLRFDELEPEDEGCACAAVAALHRLGFRAEKSVDAADKVR